MRRINGLDDVERSISAKAWQCLCMGQREDGEPKGSPNTWAQWRSLVGIVQDDGETPDLRRDITRKEAFLLLTRSRLKEICTKLKIKKPPIKPIDPSKVKPLKEYLNIFNLEKIADRWLDSLDPNASWESALNFLASRDGMTATQLEALIREWLGKPPSGKPRSQRTIYRVCTESGVRFSRKKTYSAAQVNRVFQRIQKTR